MAVDSRLIAFSASSLILALALMLGRRWRWARVQPRRSYQSAVFLGGVAGLLSALVRSWLIGALAWPLPVHPERDALLAPALSLLAPVEEGLKLLCLLPLMEQHRRNVAWGVSHAVAMALAFGALGTLVELGLGLGGWVGLLRTLLSLCGHVTATAAWGAALGARRWLFRLGVVSALGRALLDFAVLQRGPGLLVLALPLCAGLGAYAYLSVRALHRSDANAVGMRRSAAPGAWLQAPMFEQAITALENRPRRLRPAWVLAALLVNAGSAVVAIAGAVVIAQRWGLRAHASEDDLRSNVVLLLMGTSLSLAFAVSGALISRASRSSLLLEPGLGAALTVGGVSLYLAADSSVAAITTLSFSPLAFWLSLLGAWWVERTLPPLPPAESTDPRS